jgi:predicted cupin superfamily sugar epimerase
MNSKDIIKKLNLEPHREIGYFKSTYKSDIIIDSKEYETSCSIGEAIFYLLEGTEILPFHRLKFTDEIYHHYLGSTLIVHLIDNCGKLTTVNLGKDIDNNEIPQLMIGKNTWFAASLKDKTKYTLIGATLTPAFDIQGYESGKRDQLIQMYPQYADIIKIYAR